MAAHKDSGSLWPKREMTRATVKGREIGFTCTTATTEQEQK